MNYRFPIFAAAMALYAPAHATQSDPTDHFKAITLNYTIKAPSGDYQLISCGASLRKNGLMLTNRMILDSYAGSDKTTIKLDGENFTASLLTPQFADVEFYKNIDPATNTFRFQGAILCTPQGCAPAFSSLGAKRVSDAITYTRNQCLQAISSHPIPVLTERRLDAPNMGIRADAFFDSHLDKPGSSLSHAPTVGEHPRPPRLEHPAANQYMTP